MCNHCYVDWQQPPYPWVKATWHDDGVELLHANGHTLRARNGPVTERDMESVAKLQRYQERIGP